MTTKPPIELQHGLRLLQAGRRAEAADYLRRAVQARPLTPEIWLWLASATDDITEYRRCVENVLRLDPTNETALDMQAQLDRIDQESAKSQAPPLLIGEETVTRGEPLSPDNSYSIPPPMPTSAAASVLPPPSVPIPPTSYSAPYATPQPRSRRAQFGLMQMILSALAVTICLCVGASLLIAGPLRALVDQSDSESDALEFTVSSDPAYRFRVEVRDTWLLADLDQNSWQEKQSQLTVQFPEMDWEQFATSYSRVTRDPVYGQIMPKGVTLLETDVGALARDNVVPALTLQEIVPLPSGSDVCEQMSLLAQQISAEDQPTEVLRRSQQEDCIVVVHQQNQQMEYNLSTSAGPVPIRQIWIAVPAGDQRYAAWSLTLAESGINHYQPVIDDIIASLEYVDE